MPRDAVLGNSARILAVELFADLELMNGFVDRAKRFFLMSVKIVRGIMDMSAGMA